MIPFNATLVVQIFNFIATWWFLDRFLFRVYVIEAEVEAQEKVMCEQAVVLAQHELKDAKIVYQEHKDEAQRLFAKALPSPDSLTSSSTNVSTNPFFYSQECDVVVKNQIVESTVDGLQKRISSE